MQCDMNTVLAQGGASWQLLSNKKGTIPPDQGLEPWALRLKVWCSTDWANRAHIFWKKVAKLLLHFGLVDSRPLLSVDHNSL